MSRLVLRSAVRFVVTALIVAAITYVYFKLVHVNPTTVGFSFLLAVLIVSARWGLAPALFMAIVATLAYNLFFLPPIGTVVIADPQNWIALATFLSTAVIASHLSDRARREAMNANRRRHDIERLYAFSQQLLTFDNVLKLFNSVPLQVVEAFGSTAAAMFLRDRGRTYYSGMAAKGMINEDALHLTAGRGELTADEATATYFVALRIGMRNVGALGVVGGTLSRETLEAIGSLIAIAVERATAMEQLGRAEATRESEKLRTVLLDSVTHEFRTPLTSILASAKALISDDRLGEAAREELLTVINEEGERLNRLIGEAAEMAQLDAQQVELQLRPQNMSAAIEGALEESSRTLQGHPVQVSVPEGLPRVRMDLKRIQEVIAHFLDNAAKYAPAGTPIHITAEVQGSDLKTSVADHGPGIDEFEQSFIFDKFYRGKGQRLVPGTGMGLAIVKAIVEAHGGTVGVTSQLGHGSVFYLTIPLA